MTDEAGWNYTNNPTKEGGDSRKLCTIDVDGMTFVGIRIWVSGRSRWESNGEPCPHENVRAWQDLPEPARGRWYRGKLAFPSKGPAVVTSGLKLTEEDRKFLGSAQGEHGE